ncbi:hypothetical protein ACFL3G_04510 [Planctomycetota bacterium]
MDYKGKYKIFDALLVKTYPLKERTNKVHLENIVDPKTISAQSFDVGVETVEEIEVIAQKIVAARKAGKPVIVFTGAHLIKNGLSRLLIELVKLDMVTLIAGTGAVAIHDFELALIGQTSEYVPNALEEGQFGMAYEFAYPNTALQLGNKYKLGYGESLAKMICDETFRDEVLAIAAKDDSPKEFSNKQLSVLAACYEKSIPFTVHVGIGTDVIDQHKSFDGKAKGGCSGRDFLIYAEEVTKLTQGGVVLNIGSAVTGPEVFLKAVSMAGNIGKTPDNITTADFDLRKHEPAKMTDEAAQCYYFRDQKSVVTRIPQAFNGKGYYIQGNQKATVPLLYKNIMKYLRKNNGRDYLKNN